GLARSGREVEGVAHDDRAAGRRREPPAPRGVREALLDLGVSERAALDGGARDRAVGADREGEGHAAGEAGVARAFVAEAHLREVPPDDALDDVPRERAARVDGAGADAG